VNEREMRKGEGGRRKERGKKMRKKLKR